MRDRPGTLRSARARSRVFPSARIRTRAGNPWSIGSVPYPFRHALMALLCAPLTAQQGKRLQYVFRKLQKVGKKGMVERLTRFIVPSLVGRQHFPVPERLEDLVGAVQLRRGQTSRGRASARSCAYRLQALRRGAAGACQSAHTRNTFMTSSPRWLMTLTAIRPDVGRSNGRERSLRSVAQASSLISALRVVFRAL